MRTSSKFQTCSYNAILLVFTNIWKTKKASSAIELALYRRRDSNPHARRHTHLKRARLPISPLRHFSIVFELNRNRKEQFCGTGGGTRTRTLLPILDFESSASTDSATPAVPNHEPVIEKMDSLTLFRSAVGKCRKVFFYAQEVSLF